MSPSITLSNLSWSTPDGRRVLSDLNLRFGRERAGLVGRNGVGKTTLFNLIAGTLAPAAGSVSVDGRVALLRQEVTPGEGETVADLFGVSSALDILKRADHGDASMDDLAAADWTLDARAAASLAKLGLDTPLRTPLTQLSGGQRTRAGLAALIFAEPDFILLDEPTNNLDRDGRAAVGELVSGWRSGAIVISHDRDLLERMDAVVELTTLGATRYGGGWSRYREQKATELAAAEHDLAEADKVIANVARNAQAIAERQARRNSVGKQKAARGDMPKIMIGQRRETSERTNAALAETADRQKSAAAEAQAEARKRIEILQPMSVKLASVGLSAGKQVLELDRVTAGYDPARPILADLSLSITGPERVALVGPNGSGKTTLLRLIAGDLTPSSGTVRVHTRYALFDQQVSLLDPAQSIRDNYRRINEAEDENACRAALARFMFRAEAATQIVGTLSGGQRLRAGLACVIGGATPPPLLILDEPTNHLDIASIESVEAGLRAYDGALLVVSHDAAFLDAIGIERRVEIGQKRSPKSR